MGGCLHRGRFGANPVEPEVFGQPHRLAGIEPCDMFAADQGDHIAKPRDMQVDQQLAMRVLFLRHTVKNGGRGRIAGAQFFGIAAVDAGVILFRGNRQRQDFLLAQVGKTASVRQAGDHRTLLFRTVLI